MSSYGVARAEELSAFLEGEVRRINLGEYVVVELTDESAEGFPGTVVASEDEARRLAANESGVIAESPDA